MSRCAIRTHGMSFRATSTSDGATKPGVGATARKARPRLMERPTENSERVQDLGAEPKHSSDRKQRKENRYMETGTVKFFNHDRGFGFIAPASGEKDVFVHASNVVAAGSLEDGQQVQFEVAQGAKGLE